jgi:hypothetical protein
MTANVMITPEKTRDAGKLEQYEQLTPGSFQKHRATCRPIWRWREVWRELGWRRLVRV